MSILSLAFCHATAQDAKSDSLRALLKKDKEDTAKVDHLNALARSVVFRSLDSTFTLSTQALIILKNVKYPKGEALAYHNLGIYYNFKGEYFLALENDGKALAKWDELLAMWPGNSVYEKNRAKTLANTGVVYYNQGDFARALDCYFKGLRVNEKFDDKKDRNNNYIRIGLTYWSQGDLDKALDYTTKALKATEEMGDKYSSAAALANIGLVYHQKGEFDKALEYQMKALDLNREIGNTAAVALNLGNVGTAYKERHEYKKALDYFSESLKMRQELDDKLGVAAMYSNIGGVYCDEKNYRQAFDFLYRSLALSQDIGAVEYVRDNYDFLTHLYADASISLPDTVGGKMLSPEKMRLRALACHVLFINYRDSLNNAEVKKRSLQKEMQYGFDKREAAAALEYQKQMALATEQSRRQRFLLIGGGIVLLAGGVITIVIFRALRIARKQKKIIERQKHLVEEKQKEILDSIHYAKRIQRSLLTSERSIARQINHLRKKV